MIHIPGIKELQSESVLIRLEGDNNYTNIYIQHQLTPLLASRSLMYFQKQLPDFLRVSKSTLINPAFVVRLVKKERAFYLRLADGALVLISRRRVTETITAIHTGHMKETALPE